MREQLRSFVLTKRLAPLAPLAPDFPMQALFFLGVRYLLFLSLLLLSQFQGQEGQECVRVIGEAAICEGQGWGQ